MEHLLARRARTARSSVIRDLLTLVDQPGMLSLAGGLPAAECFPVDRIRQAALATLEVAGPLGVGALQYGPTEGDSSLRATLGAHTGAGAARVLVTAGSQQALDLIARALLDPGDVVVVERPGYVGAIQALRTCEPELVGVTADADGLDTDELADRLAAGLRPKLVYTVPNFQNPSGAVMAEPRRRALADLADRYGFLIVEDDPYGELRFAGSALPSIAAFTDRVLRLGTVSKVLAPGLRVGWVVAPAALMGPLVRLKQAADLHTGSLAQRIADDILRDDEFMAEHLQRIRAVYAERAAALAAALPPGITAATPTGGLFLWARVADHGGTAFDAADLAAVALQHGVAFVPGAAFDLDDRPGPALRLSFASLPPDGLREAASRLGRAHQALASTSHSAFTGNASVA